MSLEYTEHPEHDMAEIVIDGKVTADEMRDLMSRMDAFIQQNGRIKVLEIVKNFGGVDPSSLLEGIKFDVQHARSYSHCAVVTDSGWLGPLARLASAWPGLKVRTFGMDKEAEARQWLIAA